MISLSVDRASLTLPALVFAEPDTGRWVDEDGLSYPAKRWRKEYADSRNLHGSVLLRATLEHASISATLYLQAADAAALTAAKAEAEAAFGQFFYPVTVTDDGGPITYSADPADVDWGPADSGMARAHLARATVLIPVYPVGA